MGGKAVNTMEREEIPLNKREIAVRNALRKFKNISSFKLMSETQSTRPSNEIVTLRKKGYVIKTTYEKNENTGKIYGVYTLISEPGEDNQETFEDFEQIQWGCN